MGGGLTLDLRHGRRQTPFHYHFWRFRANTLSPARVPSPTRIAAPEAPIPMGGKDQ
jgi:hypothetical protein